MNAKQTSLALAAVAALLAGCTKNPFETPSTSNGLSDLEIASVNSVQTRAVIDGTTFPQTGHIGLFLFKDEGATTLYAESGCSNVDYSYDSSKSKWTANPSIKVGSTSGYLYGYYPYTAGTLEKPVVVTAIPIASSLNGDDVMYASKQTTPVTDKTAASTSIVMNHALARIALTVKKSNYTGAALLTNIKFTNGAGTKDEDKVKISASGTLNAVDGSITATRAESVSFAVSGDSQTISTSGTLHECLLVPSASVDARQDVMLTLTIDNIDKSVTLSGDNGVTIKSGVKSTVTLTLSDTGLTVSSVSIVDWGNGTSSTGSIGEDL